MAKTKSERMKAYRAKKKALLGDEWLKKENERVNRYFVPIAELPQTIQQHKRQLNRQNAEKHRKRLKLTDNNDISDEVKIQMDIPNGLYTCNEYYNGASTTHYISPMTVKMPFMSTEQSRESQRHTRVSRVRANHYHKNCTLEDKKEDLKRQLNTVMERLNQEKHRQISLPAPSTPRNQCDSQLLKSGVDPTTPSALKLEQNITNINEPQGEIDNTEDQEVDNCYVKIEPTNLEVMENEYVVIAYDRKCYIGKVVALDEVNNVIEVTCMEACGKTEGQYKWPRLEDKIWVAKGNILKKIDEPQATGRSRRSFSVDADTIDFMK